VAPDGRIYVSEGSNCRIRRITPADVLAQKLQCSTRLVDVLRPGGCALYDPPVTVHDRMVIHHCCHHATVGCQFTHVACPHCGLQISNKIGNVYYAVNSTTRNGHIIPQCLGTPPPNVAPSATGVLVSTLSMAEYVAQPCFLVATRFLTSDSNSCRAFQGYTYPEVHDQLDVGDTYRFYCPPGCAEEAVSLSEVVVGNDTESQAGVIGDEFYSDLSLICASAAHAGVIDDSGVRGHGSSSGFLCPIF
jgi:LCCL domain